MNVYGMRGTVSAGMFPNERAIVLTDHNGETYTLIVSAEIVSRDGVIRVRLIDELSMILDATVAGGVLDQHPRQVLRFEVDRVSRSGAKFDAD